MKVVLDLETDIIKRILRRENVFFPALTSRYLYGSLYISEQQKTRPK